MLLLSDPEVAAVPVCECGEPLLDLREHTDLRMDTRKQDTAGAWAHLRSGVLHRLLAAQALLPAGVSFLVIEGHRPAALQQRYFDSYRSDLQQIQPDWSQSRLEAEASKHVSPPTVAPHPCGAAVDLTLWADHAEVDLGTEVNATPAASDGACFTAAGGITDTAREWRRILGEALAGAGLVNYPPEWWHWSYGDRYRAAVTGAPAALYSPR